MNESLFFVVALIAVVPTTPTGADNSSQLRFLESRIQTLSAGTDRGYLLRELEELKRKSTSPSNQSRLSQSVLKTLTLCLELQAINAASRRYRSHRTMADNALAFRPVRSATQLPTSTPQSTAPPARYLAKTTSQQRARHTKQPATALKPAPPVDVSGQEQKHTSVDREAAIVQKTATQLRNMTLVNIPAVSTSMPAGRFSAGLAGFEKLLTSTADEYHKAAVLLEGYRTSLVKSPVVLRDYANKMEAKALRAEAAFMKESFADFAMQSRAMAHRHAAQAQAVAAAQAELDATRKLLTVSRENINDLKKLVAVTPASDRDSVRKLIAQFNLYLQKLQGKVAAANNAVESLGLDGHSKLLSGKTAK